MNGLFLSDNSEIFICPFEEKQNNNIFSEDEELRQDEELDKSNEFTKIINNNKKMPFSPFTFLEEEYLLNWIKLNKTYFKFDKLFKLNFISIVKESQMFSKESKNFIFLRKFQN